MVKEESKSNQEEDIMEEIGEEKSNKGKQMNMDYNQKRKVAKAISLERLYNIHKDISKYNEKWGEERNDLWTKEAWYAVGSKWTEGSIIVAQNINRILSPIGPILIATGKELSGGIITVIFLYAEFGISYYRSSVYENEEGVRKWDLLVRDTKNLEFSYRELAEILKPIRTEYLGKLGEVVESLKEKVKKDCSREWKETKEKTKEPSLIDLTLGFISYRNGWLKKLEYGSWRKFIEMLTEIPRALRLENPNARDGPIMREWEKEWDKKLVKRKIIEAEMEILQEAVSEYYQGISENEIEKKTESKMKAIVLELELKLEVVELFWKFVLLDGDLEKIKVVTSFLGYEEDEITNTSYWGLVKQECCGWKYKDREEQRLISELVQKLWKTDWNNESKNKLKESKRNLQEKIDEIIKTKVKDKDVTQQTHIVIPPKS